MKLFERLSYDLAKTTHILVILVMDDNITELKLNEKYVINNSKFLQISVLNIYDNLKNAYSYITHLILKTY